MENVIDRLQALSVFVDEIETEDQAYHQETIELAKQAIIEKGA